MKSINITSEDIYKQLVAGNSKESVGENLASDLNDLLDEAYDHYDKYIENQKAKTEKKDAMKNIFDSISAYAKLNGNDSMETDINEMSDDEISLLSKLLDAVFEASKPTTKKDEPKKTKVKIKSDDKMIEDFLNAMFN